MNDKNNDKIISRTFFRLLPVQFLLIAVGSINSIIDGAVSGRILGPSALVVIGLFFPVIKLMDVISSVLQGGSQILCGRYLGKNEIKRTTQIFSMDIALCLATSVLIMLICLTIPGILSDALGWKESSDDLVQYIRGMSFSVPATIIGAQLAGFLQLEKQEKLTYIAMTAMAVINVICNVLFLKVFGWGMLGLGISTALSSWAFVLIQISYYLTGRSVIKIRLKDLHMPDIKEIVRIGLPGALSNLCQVGRSLFLNSMFIKYTGNIGVGAYAAAGTFGCVFYAATGAIASSTRLLSSVYIGEEDRKGLNTIMRTALIKGVLLVASIACILFALAVPFTYCFYNDPSSDYFRFTLMFFRAFPLSMPLTCVCCIFINYYQSADRIWAAQILSVIDGIVGFLITCLTLVPLLGDLGFGAAQVLNGVCTTLFILGYTIFRAHKLPSSIESTLVLPDDFGIPEEDRLDIAINSIDDVINTSEYVMSFCQKHNISKKHAFYSGLCVEEMAGNIVQYGFKKDKKNTIDMRVALNRKKGLLILRFKDDCRPFDPKERVSMFDPQDDPAHNIGIRLIANICDSMEYGFILGLNVLTLTLPAV
jgi:Na+-driven multidrug efflux pump/anti-sigma regulatory factor (Ser/Thr protein kinase)